MHVKLIAINTFVFIFISLFLVIDRVIEFDSSQLLTLISDVFTLQTKYPDFLIKPWGFLTSIFSHFDFLHFLFNMIFLYLSGSYFLKYFSSNRLLHLYIIGGLLGGFTEVIAHLIFSKLNDLPVVGASGAIMSIFISLAFHKPQQRVNMVFFEVPLILFAGIYILQDFVSIGNDFTAHFAHLGGALIGYLSVRNLHSSKNIINFSEKTTSKIKVYFSNMFKGKPKMKVEKGGRTAKTDEQFNAEKKQKQDEINKILDKISKSGYDSLSKAEKEFLFSQSNKR